MTSIHAQPRRTGPLTAIGVNTGANTSSVTASGKGGSSNDSGSKQQHTLGVDSSQAPALKKAKSDVGGQAAGKPAAAAASKVKKSLKRL